MHQGSELANLKKHIARPNVIPFDTKNQAGLRKLSHQRLSRQIVLLDLAHTFLSSKHAQIQYSSSIEWSR